MKKQPSSRRSFLQKAALVTAGATLLSGTKTAASVFNLNANNTGYNPYTDNKTDLRTAFSTAPSVRVQGRVIDKYTQLPLANAKIEVWHISPGSSKVRHRAHFYTDATGAYSFITDEPGKTKEFAQRIHFKISSGSRVEQTQLILGTYNACIDNNHWDRQQAYNNSVLPKVSINGGNKKITFVNAL